MVQGIMVSWGDIDGEPSDDDVACWDAEAVRLSRHYSRSRLAFGEALAALGDGFEENGFSTFAGYVRERTSYKPRWCAESRTMARRLADLGRIRRALRSDEVRWSMAELLARHATPDDEEELLEACRGETVRSLRAILRERGSSETGAQTQGPEEEPDARYRTLDLTGSVEEILALDASRLMVWHMNGGPGEPGHWMECLLGDAHVTLLDLAGDIDPLTGDVVARQQRWVDARKAAEQRNVEAEERATPEPMPASDLEGEAPEDEEPLPTDPVGLDRVIRQRAQELASRDVRLGELLDRLWSARAWERLGYATETQYALDRFGMSRSAVRERITLTRRARWLDGLSDAVQRSDLGFEHARLVARVASPDTLEAWIERAGKRTFKHLKEEVRLVELVMRVSDRFDAPPQPPGDEEVELLHALESDILSGAFIARVLGPDEPRDERVSPDESSTMLHDAEGEPYWQRGGHVEETEAMIRAVVEQRDRLAAEAPGDARATANTAVQMSVGTPSLEDRMSGDGHGAVVQMSVGPASVADHGTGGGHDAAVQMSVGAASVADRGTGGGHDAAVQMSVGAASVADRGSGEGHGAVVQMSAGSRSTEASEASGSGATGTSKTVSGVDPVEIATKRADRAAHRQESRRWARGARASMRLVVREDVALHYRELEAAFERSGLPGTFLEFLSVVLWFTHGRRFAFGTRAKPVFDRDRHQCTSPVCERRTSLSNHHIVYRSHGGGDELSNQITGCHFDHLDGEHGGRLKVRGTAEAPTWWLGRVPIMKVIGRTKIELTAP